MTTHSSLSPSKRHRWALCPGSIREEAKYPDSRSGPAAIDGTHSHTLLEYCLSEGVEPSSMVGQVLSDDDGSFKVDNDRASRVKVATDYVKQRIGEQFGMCHVLAETRVDPTHLLGRTDMGGTVDIQIKGTEVLEIIDYKDGMGIVDVKDNYQLQLYAFGALSDLKIPDGGTYPWKRVRMTVVQPKMAIKGMKSITSSEVSVSDILGMIDTLTAEGQRCDDVEAPLVPGDSQCKFCKAKGSCAALANNVMKEVGIMFQPVNVNETLDVAQQSADKDPTTMDDAQIAQIMEAAPLMRQLLEGVEKEALRRMQAGQSIPGLKLVNGRGSRAWSLTEDDMAVKLVKMGIPKTAIYETKLVSVAKAEKLSWEKRNGEKVSLSQRQLDRMSQEYVVKLAGKLTVVSESDERKAVTTNAAPMFGAVDAPTELPAWLS